MTTSEILRAHALYHRTGRIDELPSDTAWAAVFRFLDPSDLFSREPITSEDRRAYLLYVAEALES